MKKLLLIAIVLLSIVACSKKESTIEILSTPSDSVNIAKVDTTKTQAVIDTVKKQ